LFTFFVAKGEKAARKMLVKSTPGVNFTNILRAAFTTADPKSAKNTLKTSVFFALLGSESVKAFHKMFVKSYQSCQFHKNFTMSFFYAQVFCTTLLYLQFKLAYLLSRG